MCWGDLVTVLDGSLDKSVEGLRQDILTTGYDIGTSVSSPEL